MNWMEDHKIKIIPRICLLHDALFVIIVLLISSDIGTVSSLQGQPGASARSSERKRKMLCHKITISTHLHQYPWPTIPDTALWEIYSSKWPFRWSTDIHYDCTSCIIKTTVTLLLTIWDTCTFATYIRSHFLKGETESPKWPWCTGEMWAWELTWQSE